MADRLTTDYLTRVKGAKAQETLAYQSVELNSKENTKILSAAYRELSEIYTSNQSEELKKREKGRVYAHLKTQLKLKRDINNATLIQYKTYNTGESEFQTLLIQCGFDWSRFLMSMKRLKPESFTQPQQETFKAVLSTAIQANCTWSSIIDDIL